MNVPARSSATRPASRSRPRWRDTPDWASPRIEVSSDTFSDSRESNRRTRNRVSSPRSRSKAEASLISMNLHVLIIVCNPAEIGQKQTWLTGTESAYARVSTATGSQESNSRARSRRRSGRTAPVDGSRRKGPCRPRRARRDVQLSLYGCRKERARPRGGPRKGVRGRVDHAHRGSIRSALRGRQVDGRPDCVTGRGEGLPHRRRPGSSSLGIHCIRRASLSSAATSICPTSPRRCCFSTARDPFGSTDEMTDLANRLSGSTLHIVEGGDHSLMTRKKVEPGGDALDKVMDQAAEWMRRVLY